MAFTFHNIVLLAVDNRRQAESSAIPGQKSPFISGQSGPAVTASGSESILNAVKRNTRLSILTLWLWEALKKQLSTLESLGAKARDKAKEQMKDVKISRKSLEGEIVKLKAEKIRQYELYADGVTSKQQYLRKKTELSATLENLEQDCKAQAEEYDYQNELWESASTLSEMAKSFAGETKLSRQLVSAFIENVYIYDPKRVEIIFRHEDEVVRLAESLQE